MTMTAATRVAVASPSINPAHAEVRRWLEEFAASVRAVDYDRGRAMFAEEVVGFGTFARMLVGRENLIAGQWKNIWGCTRGFRFVRDGRSARRRRRRDGVGGDAVAQPGAG